MTRSLFLGPQILFAASCAGAVFSYIYFNIDSIREQQKLAIDKAMREQSGAIRNAEDAQKSAIDRIKREQEYNIRKAKESADAVRRKLEEDAAARRRDWPSNSNHLQ